MGATCGHDSANVMSNDVSFASPTAIWRSPWRLEPFPSAQKEAPLPSYFDVSLLPCLLFNEVNHLEALSNSYKSKVY